MKPYYEDDSVTLYHGDCRDNDAWLAADVVVTDPPYGIGWKRSAHPARRSKPHAGIANDQDTSARDEALVKVADKPAIVFGSFYAPRPQGTVQVLVWHKPDDSGVVGSTTGFRRDVEPVYLVGPWPQHPVQRSGLLRSHQRSIKAICAATGHPHTKPLDVMRVLVQATPHGVVADPFAGVGTTLLAAKQLGRQAIGVELDERYCEVAAKRLAQEVLDFGAVS